MTRDQRYRQFMHDFNEYRKELGVSIADVASAMDWFVEHQEYLNANPDMALPAEIEALSILASDEFRPALINIKHHLPAP